MRIILLLLLLVFCIIRILFCGYATKSINESKGYSGGFLMGVLLAELGVIIAAQKIEQPDAELNAYRAVLLKDVLKKHHYPFSSPQVEPIDDPDADLEEEAEIAKVNISFYIIHGLFMLLWYCVIIGAYLWYLIGYTIYWIFKFKLLKKGTEGIKSNAAETAALAKEKAGAALNGLKGKASAFAADLKKNNNSNAPVNNAASEVNNVTQNITPEPEVNNVDASTDPASFDELYKKAMNSLEEEEADDETAYNDVESSYAGNEAGQPSAEHHVNPQPDPVNPQPEPEQFRYEEKKKSPIVFVLFGLIAVLLIGIGILGGMLLMKDKNSKSDDSMIDNAPTAAESTDSAEPKITGSGLEKAAKSVLLEMDEEGIDISGKYIICQPRRASYNIPDNFDVGTFLDKITDYFESEDSYVWFVLVKDGNVETAAIGESWDSTAFGRNETLQELFYNAKDELQEFVDTTTTIAETTIAETTTVAETTVVETQPAATSSADPYAAIKQEILDSVDNEHYSGKNSHIENAPSDMRFYNMSERYNMNVSSPTVYEGPGTNYSIIEVYSDFFWVYGENSDWYYVEWGEGNGAFSHCCYGYMSKSSNNNSAAKYTEYDTSAAGSDFSFNNEPYSRKVRTESGNLNLRAAPSTSAEIIIEMPKDSSVSLWGVNSEWAYVSYTVNGTTYYGYASRQYIGLP